MALSAVRDRTNIFNIVVTNSDGTRRSLTGSQLRFVVKAAYTSASELIAKSSPSSGITFTDEADGEAQLELSAADTELLSATRHMVYEVVLVEASKPYSVDSGRFTLEPQVANI